jgi:hypothetical protein
MKSAGFIALWAGFALLGVDALRLEKRNKPAVVKVPLQRKVHPNLPRPLKTRQTVETPDENWYPTSINLCST